MFDLSLFFVVVAASARITRLVVTDTITDPVRAWALPRIARSRFERERITRGLEANPPTRIRQFFLDLLQCPWCIGFWISGVLLGATFWALGPWISPIGIWWVDLVLTSLGISYLVGWLSDQEAP